MQSKSNGSVDKPTEKCPYAAWKRDDDGFMVCPDCDGAGGRFENWYWRDCTSCEGQGGADELDLCACIQH